MAKRHAKILIKFCFIFLFQTQTEAYHNDAVFHVKANVDIHRQRFPRVAIKTNENLHCEKPTVYICEEPPTHHLVPPARTKLCSYRNTLYHEQVFRWVAGRGCLLYTPDFLYVNGVNSLNLNAGCYYGDLFAPCLEIVKDDGKCGCYPFDPGLEEVLEAVREAQISAVHGRWEQCFYEASYCCSHFMGQKNSVNLSEPHCTATFDGWTCWLPTEPETVAQEICSQFAYGSEGPSCDHYSSKKCHANGTWDLQSDYSTCSVTPRLIRRYEVHIIILAITVVVTLPAVVVFFFNAKLRITRLALHRNLLIAITLRNIAVIISRSEVYLDELTNNSESAVSVHSIACRILAIIEKTTNNAVFVCMLMEGFYIHRLVAESKQKMNIYILYGIGTVITLAPVITWSVVMGIYNDHSCWLVYTVDHVQWILDIPLAAILLINTGLFVDVLRVLTTKKTLMADITNDLHTALSALVLMPLFGLFMLLTSLKLNTSDCNGEQLYHYGTYAVEGLQGILASVLYCYFNKEVLNAIKSGNKNEESNQSKFQNKHFRSKQDTRPKKTRENHQSLTSDNTNLYATVLPRLQVAEIISINTPESLAEVLEPQYESVALYTANATYDNLDRAQNEIYSNRANEESVTNVSSQSIEYQDWIRCVSSPNSSFYHCNSLNEYEIQYLKKKFPDHFKHSQSLIDLSQGVPNNIQFARIFQRSTKPKRNNSPSEDNAALEKAAESAKETDSSEFNDSELLDEILQIISSDSASGIGN